VKKQFTTRHATKHQGEQLAYADGAGVATGPRKILARYCCCHFAKLSNVTYFVVL